MASSEGFWDSESRQLLDPFYPLDPFKPLNPGRRRPTPKRPFEVNYEVTLKGALEMEIERR